MINAAFKRRFFAATLLFLSGSLFWAQATRPIVSSINAYPSSTTTIIVSWILPKKTEGSSISSLKVYRDTRPLAGQNALKNLTPVATLPHNAVSYTDTVSDFREYYYAVISLTKPGDYTNDDDLYYDEDLDKTDTSGGGEAFIVLLPGVNATVNGVRVKSPIQKSAIKPKTESAKEKLYADGTMREQPLPYLDILGITDAPDPTISKSTQEKALALVGGKQTHQEAELLDPYLFEQDLMSPAGGDEYLLFETLRTTFVQKNYPAATAALQRFLAQNRATDVTDRANFYLGESYYYCGKYKEALSKFLDLEDTFTTLSRKWVESTLELYEIPQSENEIVQ